MDIENLLKNYSKQVEPDAAAKKRVFNVISARMEENNLNIKQESMLQKLVSKRNWYFATPLLALSLIALFFAPVLFLGGSEQVINAPVDEATGVASSDGSTVDLFRENVADTEKYGYEPIGNADQIYPDYYPNPDEDTTTPESDRAKLKEGYFLLEGSDIQGKFNQIKNFAESSNGYVLTSNFHSGKQATATIIMRVPADKFDEVSAKIRELDLVIVNESIQTLDKQNELTESLQTKSDLQKDIKKLEKQLNTTTNAAEKERLETEIGLLKNQLEVANNKIETLQEETEYSTIEVSLRESQGSNFLNEISGNFESALTFWILVFSWLGIPLLVLLIVILVIKRMYKKNKTKKNK